MGASDIWGLLKETYTQWSEDKVPKLGASLAYYTVFSLAPLLIIAIAIVGFFYGEGEARNQIVGQIGTLVGPAGASAIEDMLNNASRPGAGIVATLLGIATLLFGASGVFGELQDSLNTIWEVQPKPGRGIWGTIKDRFFSFSLVVGTGFLLLVSLVVTAVLAAIGGRLEGALPGGALLWQIINFVISFGVITLLFATIYKYLPDVEISWHDVWIGGAFTALLFVIGRLLLGLYLGNSSTTSVYGAAGSLVVILLWVYYTAQILFFGAEFTQVYANRYGSHIVPDEDAMPLTEEARANMGIPHNAPGGEPGQARQVGGATLPEAADEPAARRQPGRAGALASFLVGLVVGRRFTNGNDKS
jgi:membrane protein